MAGFTWVNNVSTTLADSANDMQTTLTLASTENFPAITSGEQWAITLNDAATKAVFEICYVTSISGAVVTVLRGQEGTTAQSWLVGDYVFAGVTAAQLGEFTQSGGDFVELSPGSAQDGFVSVTGAITGGIGTFEGVDAGGALSAATTGDFSATVTARELDLTLPYGAASLADLPIQIPGDTGNIGVGPSSSLTASGITAQALAVGLGDSSDFVAIDIDGNLGATGTIAASVVTQAGTQVLSEIISPDGTIVIGTSGGVATLDVNASAPPVGFSVVADANPTPAQINAGYNLAMAALPPGTWFVQMICSGFGLGNTPSDTIGMVAAGGSYPGISSLSGIGFSRTLYLAGTAAGGDTPTAQMSGQNVTYAAGSDAIFLVITAIRTE